MSDSLITQIKSLSSTFFEEVRGYRRHLHMHPELSNEESATADFICMQLDSMGITYTRNVAGNGVVALIPGEQKSDACFALRADMDALPITEKNTVDYCSQHPGVMHACGHDVHMSCVLGAAKILMQLRAHFSGTVKLIFQPSEEKLPGGAKNMIAAGALNTPDVQGIIGQHVFTPFHVGTVAFCFGPMMASTDEIYITVNGKGGHAAYPQELKDPVLMSAQLLVALQQLVSREVSPFAPAVLSFGKVQANGATNVIPDSVYIEGTLRTLNEALRTQLHASLERTVHHIVEGFGGTADLRIATGYPVLENDEALSRRTYDRAVAYLGEENVIVTTPRMGAEDFAFYAQKIPACFYRLGTGNPEKGIVSNIHTPTFDIDEEAMKTGMGLMAWHAISELMPA
ncbi:MAG: M20 family metallopeptidase [Chitinophagales bacterium]